MNIAIRTDASTTIGSGHVMRCLCLAEELKQHNVKVCFICREHDGNLNDKIAASGFEIIPLPLSAAVQSADHDLCEALQWIGDSLDNDARDTVQALNAREKDWDWLIVDHYHLDQKWEGQLRSIAKRIMVIDDLANRPHDCDLLLDQNFVDTPCQRYLKYIPESCQTLLGPRYALLRPEFRLQRNESHTVSRQVKRIVIFFGGADTTNETEKTLNALAKAGLDYIDIDVIIGPSNPHYRELQERCSNQHKFHLHRDINNIAEIMRHADLAIGAGGTTTWERCCVGVPTIAWPIAENQRQLLNTTSHHGAVYLLHDTISGNINSLAKVFFSVCENQDLRHWIRQKGLELVDGNGTRRVTNRLLPVSITLRQASIEDARTIYEWRNQPEIRKVSTQSDAINWDTHLKWINKTLADKQRLLFIAEDKQQPVGVIRYDLESVVAEVSIYLAPSVQGRGYGHEILQQGELWLRQHRTEVKTIKAMILHSNQKSRLLFSDAGFEENSRIYIKGL